MSKASDILRLRAFAMEVTTSDVREVLRAHADVYRAVADLMEASTEIDEVHGLWCRLCDDRHEPNCTLAALERAIIGESDAEGK